jgi:hypothetical protein
MTNHSHATANNQAANASFSLALAVSIFKINKAMINPTARPVRRAFFNDNQFLCQALFRLFYRLFGDNAVTVMADSLTNIAVRSDFVAVNYLINSGLLLRTVMLTIFFLMVRAYNWVLRGILTVWEFAEKHSSWDDDRRG